MAHKIPLAGEPTSPLSLLEIDTSSFHALVVKIDDHRPDKANPSEERLTQAETEVARAVVSGLSNREIAEQRGAAVRTVAVQLHSIYRKMGISSRTELAALIGGRLHE
jgi:DNA-binding NarL/FixJ family response regulator